MVIEIVLLVLCDLTKRTTEIQLISFRRVANWRAGFAEHEDEVDDVADLSARSVL